MKYSQKSHSGDRNHNMTVVLFTLLCVLICGSLALSPKAQTKTSDEHVTPKTVPGRNGKIAFTSSRDGNHEIYTMEADGSNQTRLTNNPGYDISPKWSPDGTKIAFLRSNGFQYDIYVMNADGSNQTRLTNNLVIAEPPDWSPDGTRIVFHFQGVGNSFTNEIFVVNADGTNLTQLTNSGGNTSPEWSPDGTRIVFRSLRDNNVNIYVMNADGTSQTRLTNYTDEDYDVVSPIFSPDGMRIMFHYGLSFAGELGTSEIYVMNADGSNLVRLTNTNGYEAEPDWQALPQTSPSCPNPIDCAEFFVRQHYLDFLNRQPDATGLNFWIDNITSCGFDAHCVEVKRIDTSAAFFLSIEFQETGYLVYRIYKSAYGDIPGTPVPLRLNEFLPDTQQIGQGVIVNQTGWEQVLENNKQAFMTEFVQRSRFTSAYPTLLTPEQFVDQLFLNSGVTPSATDRADAINEFGSASTTTDTAARARALRRVAENSTLALQEFNRAFVLMQYFGYLRRNPNDPPEPGLDFAGYNFWLTKLNQFNSDFRNADMVKSFLVSTEYRQCFGTP